MRCYFKWFQRCSALNKRFWPKRLSFLTRALRQIIDGIYWIENAHRRFAIEYKWMTAYLQIYKYQVIKIRRIRQGFYQLWISVSNFIADLLKTNYTVIRKVTGIRVISSGTCCGVLAQLVKRWSVLKKVPGPGASLLYWRGFKSRCGIRWKGKILAAPFVHLLGSYKSPDKEKVEKISNLQSIIFSLISRYIFSHLFIMKAKNWGIERKARLR